MFLIANTFAICFNKDYLLTYLLTNPQTGPIAIHCAAAAATAQCNKYLLNITTDFHSFSTFLYINLKDLYCVSTIFFHQTKQTEQFSSYTVRVVDLLTDNCDISSVLPPSSVT